MTATWLGKSSNKSCRVFLVLISTSLSEDSPRYIGMKTRRHHEEGVRRSQHQRVTVATSTQLPTELYLVDPRTAYQETRQVPCQVPGKIQWQIQWELLWEQIPLP